MQSERLTLEKRLVALRAKYNAARGGGVIPSPKAMRLKQQINEIKERIAKLDRDAAEQLAIEKAPIDDVLEVIAIPLLADVLNDVVAGVDATLRRNGVSGTVFGIYTAQIRKCALAMVDTLDTAESHLPKLLDVDDTLVDAIRKKLMSFIRHRLNIT